MTFSTISISYFSPVTPDYCLRSVGLYMFVLDIVISDGRNSIPARGKNFVFAIVPKPALGPSYIPAQSVTRVSSPKVK
jgi:hypothetical protein